jgi:hypothetical protein
MRAASGTIRCAPHVEDSHRLPIENEMRTLQTRRLLTLLAAGLLGVGVSACGNTSKDTASTTGTAPPSTTGVAPSAHGRLGIHKGASDVSPESGTKPHNSSEDRSVLDLGHAADATDRALIAALVQRYYKAEADENGAAACSMLYSPYAESVPEDYGTSPPGPPYARGTTCPAVMTLVFQHFHGQIAARLPKLEVSRVRLVAHQGVAVLSFGAMPEREIHVAREGHTWRVVALTDTELP